MFDIHSHFIPKIDDGSKSVEMSVDMLHLSYEQGIRHMVATPHFYINHNKAERFVATRRHCLEKIKPFIDDKMPNIYTGAEVYFFNGISAYDELELLTINNSRYLLLEMPFTKWSKKILDEVEKLIYDKRYNIIVAHIERFIDYQKGTSYINDLLSLNPVVQINGEFVNSFFTRKRALNLIKDGVVQVLGSDCHNMTNRQPNLDKAYEIIGKKLGAKAVNDICNMGRKILNID